MKLLSILLFLYLLSSCTSTTDSNTYTLDMFSIVSFGLAIASIILSLFMGWLSWQLYKKSTDASDKIQSSVGKIETSVLGIRTDITEIVQKAVGFWTNSANGNNDSELTMDLQGKLEELNKKFSEMNSDDPKVDDLESKFKEVLSAQQQEIDRLKSSLFEEKVRSIFPSGTATSAINLTQEMLTNTLNENKGLLNITINRPVKIATATGKSHLPLDGEISLFVKLISSPYKNTSDVIVTCGVGVHLDFHVHLKIPGGALEIGEYVVEYQLSSIKRE